MAKSGTSKIALSHIYLITDGLPNYTHRYDLAKGISNMPGRPINLVIRNSTNFTMQGMRFVQSQFWTMATFNAENVLLEDILIRSVSNSSVRSFPITVTRPHRIASVMMCTDGR